MGNEIRELTESERRQIFRLRYIGRDKDNGTISRELRRNALLKSGYPNCISLITLQWPSSGVRRRT